MILLPERISQREKLILTGLFLAKFDAEGLNALGFESFIEAFNVVGYGLGAKPASIKNYRDEFDPLFPNARMGWHKRPTRDYCLKVLGPQRQCFNDAERARGRIDASRPFFSFCRYKLPRNTIPRNPPRPSVEPSAIYEEGTCDCPSFLAYNSVTTQADPARMNRTYPLSFEEEAAINALGGFEKVAAIADGILCCHGIKRSLFTANDRRMVQQGRSAKKQVAFNFDTGKSLRANIEDLLQQAREVQANAGGTNYVGAMFLLKNSELADRVDVLDAGQFLTANVYERSLFNSAECRVTLGKLLERYNEIVATCETDPTLRVRIPESPA